VTWLFNEIFFFKKYFKKEKIRDEKKRTLELKQQHEMKIYIYYVNICKYEYNKVLNCA